MVEVQAFTQCAAVKVKVIHSYAAMVVEYMLANARKYADKLRVGYLTWQRLVSVKVIFCNRVCSTNKGMLWKLRMSSFHSGL